MYLYTIYAFIYSVEAGFTDIPALETCQYNRMLLRKIRAWLILSYAHLAEFIFLLSNMKYILTLKSILQYCTCKLPWFQR